MSLVEKSTAFMLTQFDLSLLASLYTHAHNIMPSDVIRSSSNWKHFFDHSVQFNKGDVEKKQVTLIKTKTTKQESDFKVLWEM